MSILTGERDPGTLAWSSTGSRWMLNAYRESLQPSNRILASYAIGRCSSIILGCVIIEQSSSLRISYISNIVVLLMAPTAGTAVGPVRLR